jgi:MFS family permease
MRLVSPCLDGLPGAMMNGLQTLHQCRIFFDLPTAPILGMINDVNSIGKIIGLFPSAWLSDRYGRKRPIFFGFTILIIGAALQGAAQDLPIFIVTRLINGFRTAFIAQPSPIPITELAYPTQRGKITALYNTVYVGPDPYKKFSIN